MSSTCGSWQMPGSGGVCNRCPRRSPRCCRDGNEFAMRISDEKGIALVLSIFLMTAMSIIAASLMFLSQTETYSSLNYRLMSQARYGAESGVHKTANYILYTYKAPGNLGANAADLIGSYDITKSPVTCVAGCPTLNQ